MAGLVVLLTTLFLNHTHVYRQLVCCVNLSAWWEAKLYEEQPAQSGRCRIPALEMNSQFHLHLTELDMKRSDWVLNFNLSSCLSLYVYICAHMYIYRCDYNWLHTYMWFYIHIIHTHFSGWDFRVEIISPVLWGASGTIPRSVRAMACHRAELPLQVRRWMDQCDGKHGIFNGVWCFNQWDHIFFFVLESCFFV
jgi:hypothetical protein